MENVTFQRRMVCVPNNDLTDIDPLVVDHVSCEMQRRAKRMTDALITETLLPRVWWSGEPDAFRYESEWLRNPFAYRGW